MENERQFVWMLSQTCSYTSLTVLNDSCGISCSTFVSPYISPFPSNEVMHHLPISGLRCHMPYYLIFLLLVLIYKTKLMGTIGLGTALGHNQRTSICHCGTFKSVFFSGVSTSSLNGRSP